MPPAATRPFRSTPRYEQQSPDNLRQRVLRHRGLCFFVWRIAAYFYRTYLMKTGLTGCVRDITGTRNGRLVALECVGRNGEGRAMWLCKCDCGGAKTVQSNNLLRPAGSKSCGCLLRETNSKKVREQGAWNEGKSYAIGGGARCYKTRQSWAKAAIRLHGNNCQRCGWKEARCDVHHRMQKALGGLHTLDNAIVLCPNCHRVHHEGATH